MYICTFVCTYVCVYVCEYIRVYVSHMWCIYAHMYVRTNNVCVHVYTYVGINVIIYVYVCVCWCLALLRKQSNKPFRSHSSENYQQIIWALCEISWFLSGVIEAVHLLRCYAAILVDVYRRFATFYWSHFQDVISPKNEGLNLCSGLPQGLRPQNFPQ